MRIIIINVILYLLYHVDAKPISPNIVCRFGRITDIDEYTLGYQRSEYMIPSNKAWKVIRLGKDVSVTLLDTDNYKCYICDINKHKENLPYLNNCKYAGHNVTHSDIYNSLKVMVCRKSTKNSHKKVIYPNSVYYDITYGVKTVYTTGVVVCLIEKEHTWAFTIGHMIIYILALLVIFISLMPLIILYNLFKMGDIEDYDSLDEENS
ncbi:hypothetical protein 18Q061_00041 [Fowlpox virus]|nr:hypothetical protein 18Q061_00041 [Fowlpox virus]URH26065.1 hypothetical protein 18R056_00042 [Fowlpox virus]URH26328.1 hypothetical protein 18R059_00042 [Fowlpox virus]URH27117.1 hypothetical protein 05113_00041 [Fowlpox virus]URH27381.1 hypothetical protein 99866_00041 [Fowlpox virus]